MKVAFIMSLVGEVWLSPGQIFASKNPMAKQHGDRNDNETAADEVESAPLDFGDTAFDADQTDQLDESLIIDAGTQDSLFDNATRVGGQHTRNDREPTRDTDFELQLPETIGKYEVRRLLGQGSVGAVYLAFDPLIEREVAIKVLRPGLSEDPTALLRFLSEARSVGQLNHPNAIAIYEIGEENHEYFIVMELAQGGTVLNMVREQGSLSLREACDVTIQAARGLEAAHNHGLIHRDVKPENLMLSPEGTVKLVDFGLAKLVDRTGDLSLTTTGQVMGTPVYMSPEQITGDKADARTDIYSLGATFFQLLTGRPPFLGKSVAQLVYAHLEAKRPDPAKINPKLPTECANIIGQAMAIKPEDRYSSVGSMIRDLESLARSASDTDSRETAVAPRVLIVESSKLASTVVANVFRKAGCEHVVCLHSVGEAVSRASAAPPDVLITARQLQDAKCDVLLEQLRPLAESRNVMCIELSTEPPLDVFAETTQLTDTFAVARRQSPEGILSAVICCSDFALHPHRDESANKTMNVLVISQAGSAPANLSKLLDAYSADVTAIDRTELQQHSNEFDQADLVLCIGGQSDPKDEFTGLLQGPMQGLVGKHATIGMIKEEKLGLRLRGVYRKEFLAFCDKRFDQQALQRMVR